MLRSARDRRFGVSSAAKRQRRAGIVPPPLDPAADSWQKGRAPQLTLNPGNTSATH
ncbi:MAG: hypothetical protein SFV54_22575 [Bryobacteraceae bacterium]|nr:hypothetical protein [Bryobacteraceae bacterium]